MTRYTAHADTFARDNLPPPAAWPELLFELPELQYPGRLNCATEVQKIVIARELLKNQSAKSALAAE